MGYSILGLIILIADIYAIYQVLTSGASTAAKLIWTLVICSVPDDHIDPRRLALFMARSLLREIRDGGTDACSTA